MTDQPHSSLSEARATAILSEFIRSYAIGTSPRLDAVWLRAVAWQQGNPTAPADPHPDALDPYPRHR